MKEVIHTSDTPTLHYIPENPSLSYLEHELVQKTIKLITLKNTSTKLNQTMIVSSLIALQAGQF